MLWRPRLEGVRVREWGKSILVSGRRGWIIVIIRSKDKEKKRKIIPECNSMIGMSGMRRMKSISISIKRARSRCIVRYIYYEVMGRKH